MCFTTTRYHGASSGAYASLNLATHVADDEAKVERNRASLLAFLEKSDFALNNSTSTIQANAYTGPMKPLHFIAQNHSTVVSPYSESGNYPNPCDAVFAVEARRPLAILTADCLPIMIAHVEGFETAAIHAGYRGLTEGIIQNTIASLKANPNNLSVWIGPSICQKHFEIGEDILYMFAEHNKHVSFNDKTEKFHVNLQGIATDILTGLGVTNIQLSDQCTYCSDDLFSYRQSKHKGHKECGRMASIIMHL
nr:peptidoglycan editing factor PgeF [Glaciecola sp. XM2]